MQLRVRIFSKNKSMSVWILNLNVYLEHPLIGIFLVFIILFFLKKNIDYLFILLPEAAVLQ